MKNTAIPIHCPFPQDPFHLSPPDKSAPTPPLHFDSIHTEINHTHAPTPPKKKNEMKKKEERTDELAPSGELAFTLVVVVLAQLSLVLDIKVTGLELSHAVGKLAAISIGTVRIVLKGTAQLSLVRAIGEYTVLVHIIHVVVLTVIVVLRSLAVVVVVLVVVTATLLAVAVSTTAVVLSAIVRGIAVRGGGATILFFFTARGFTSSLRACFLGTRRVSSVAFEDGAVFKLDGSKVLLDFLHASGSGRGLGDFRDSALKGVVMLVAVHGVVLGHHWVERLTWGQIR